MPIPSGPGQAELPDWAPTGYDVAAYVPHRTLVRAESSTTQGEDTYRYSFDETTRPSTDQISRLIADNVAYVSLRLVPFAVSSEGAAAAIVSVLTAAACERGWPEDEYALQRANDLEKRADLMLAGLILANDLSNHDGDADGEDDRSSVLPVFSFPPADPRYDHAGYF